MKNDADKAVSGLLGGPMALGGGMDDDDDMGNEPDSDMDDDPRMSGARLLASELKAALSSSDIDAIAKAILEIRDL